MSSTSPGSRPTNVRWMIVITLMVLAFLAHFNRVSITVAGTKYFIGDGPGQVSDVAMGRVYTIFLLVYTIGMLPGGWLIDRIGPRWAMMLMAVGFGCFSVLTGALGLLGLAISAMYLPMLFIRGCAGAASVPLHPGAARTVSLWVPARERSTANGLVTAGALVGIAATYPVFGALMDRVGWPAAFAVAGAALLLLGVIWFALSSDDPSSHRWTNAAERDLVTDGEERPSRTRGTPRDFLRLFTNRGLVLLTLSYGALSYVQYMFFYWIEYYFKTVLKLPEHESRDAAFTVTIAMAVGMGMGGFVADRFCHWWGFGRGSRTIAICGMGMSAVFSLLGVSTSDPKVVVAFFALALGSLGLCEGIFWTSAPALEPRNGGLACALLNTGGNGVGMLAPLFTPMIGQAFGWNKAVVVACGICALGALLWLGINAEHKRPGEEVEEGW